VSQLAQVSQFNLQKPYNVSNDFKTLACQLAEDGIRFEQWGTPSDLSSSSSSLNDADTLSLYESEIERIKKEYGKESTDLVSVKGGDAFSISIRDRYLSEHCHSDDEIRFFLEGSVLIYIHINERVHILQCGKGDFIVIPKGVKHWLDIGPKPEFTAIRWYNSIESLENLFTGSIVAESSPRWETIYEESHFKR